MESRPNLNIEISVKDFKDFYWLKEELLEFCRTEGLKTNGGKIEISERIVYYLKTGLTELGQVNKKIKKPKSDFNWQSEKLLLETKITNNYKNTENVRKFFEQEIGKHFKFNVRLMNWMKINSGKTLEEAIEEWKRIKSEKRTTTKPKEIAPQFEYNTYLRDFLVDNPNAKREVGIKLWKIKKSLRGDNKYRRSDLKLLEEK